MFFFLALKLKLYAAESFPFEQQQKKNVWSRAREAQPTKPVAQTHGAIRLALKSGFGARNDVEVGNAKWTCLEEAGGHIGSQTLGCLRSSI